MTASGKASVRRWEQKSKRHEATEEIVLREAEVQQEAVQPFLKPPVAGWLMLERGRGAGAGASMTLIPNREEGKKAGEKGGEAA